MGASLGALALFHGFLDLLVPGHTMARVLGFSALLVAMAGVIAFRMQRIKKRLGLALQGFAETAEGSSTSPSLVETGSFQLREMEHLDQAVRKAGQAILEQQHLRDQIRNLQRNQLTGLLAREVAGDLNNRLTVLLGQLDLAQSEEGEVQRHLKHAAAAARGAAEAAQELWAFGQDTSGRTRTFNPNAVVQRVLRLLARLSDDGIRLSLDLGSGIPPLTGEVGQIEQVLLSLGVNACQAMPEGGTLTFRTRLQDGFAAITVEDTGDGIPPELLPRIWELFFTTKGPESGAGLGLPMAREILRDHGGRIQVESAPGRGSCFTVLLPLPADIPTGSVGQGAAETTDSGLAGLRVLVVDDEPAIRTVMQELLARMGAEAVVALDGEDAWNLWNLMGPFDLVITDQRMPRLNGLDLVRRIRKVAPQVPMLLVTGYGLEEASTLLASDPKVALLIKPFTVATFQSVLHRLIAQAPIRPPAG